MVPHQCSVPPLNTCISEYVPKTEPAYVIDVLTYRALAWIEPPRGGESVEAQVAWNDANVIGFSRHVRGSTVGIRDGAISRVVWMANREPLCRSFGPASISAVGVARNAIYAVLPRTTSVHSALGHQSQMPP